MQETAVAPGAYCLHYCLLVRVQIGISMDSILAIRVDPCLCLADPQNGSSATGDGGGNTQAANNTLLSRLKSFIPIICSGGTFDFVGGSPGAKVGKGEAESGIFFYQQADYSSKGWRYDSGHCVKPPW